MSKGNIGCKKMNMTIKPLTAEMANTFTTYLRELSFAHSPDWSTCYCRYYLTDCSKEAWVSRTGEDNCNEALQEIRNGSMKGYLAFDGDLCVGWCNANDVEELKRIKGDLAEYCKNLKVGCTICYVIRPEYRGMGIARMFLNRAMTDFKENGYDALIALPFEDDKAPQKRYRGSDNMYLQAGFKEIDKADSIKVMWYSL